MNSDLKDILLNSNKDIDNQQLMDYLSNELSKADSHVVEESMAEDEFINDAIEGLQHIDNKINMQAYVEQLNSDLHKQIAKNKSRRDQRKLSSPVQTYITIIVILILVIISFVVLKKYLDSRHAHSPVTANTEKINNKL